MHQSNIYGHLGTQLYPFNINTSSIMNAKPVSESQIITIDVLKADDLLRNSKYRYLDVRTEEEFNKGHVDFSDVLNIPNMFNTPEGRVKNANFMEQVQQVCTKDDHLIVGCQSGVRSVYATVDLLDAGFKHVYNMGGGFLAWVQNGLPVVTGDTKNASLSPTSLPVAVVTSDTKNGFPSPTSPVVTGDTKTEFLSPTSPLPANN